MMAQAQVTSWHLTFQEFQQFAVLIRALDFRAKNKKKIHVLHVYLSGPSPYAPPRLFKFTGRTG